MIFYLNKILSEPPADYASVYFYDQKQHIPSIKERFPPDTTGPENIFVLERSNTMQANEAFTSLPLTFVDIWNLSDWYAKDFTRALEEQIHALLSQPHH